MYKYIDYSGFMQYLFDDQKQAEKAGEIVEAILAAQSPRLSNIAEKMAGRSDSNYKSIQRFLHRADLQDVMMRLFQEEAEFVIGDPTEMPRYKAPKTSYVGTLSDGKTPGYWLLALSTPFRGRAIPFHFITYSLCAGPFVWGGLWAGLVTMQRVVCCLDLNMTRVCPIWWNFLING